MAAKENWKPFIQFFNHYSNAPKTPSVQLPMYSAMERMTDTNAPTPADFAVLGLESFQTRYNTSPATGTQHPNNPQPNPPLSSFDVASTFPYAYSYVSVFEFEYPHCGQYGL